jgi:hypothetical protein
MDVVPKDNSVTTDDLRFTEIEHKFVVDDQFDLAAFDHTLRALGPEKTTSLQVRDHYYLTDTGRTEGFLIRHRFDPELHHLTLKAVGSDTEARAEINLDLGHHVGDQQAAVDAFLDRLGVRWRGTLQKDLAVWQFRDIEVVHYQATSENRTIRCVEFEATHKPSLEDALAVVHRYEDATGFHERDRCHQSLPQMLFPEIAAALEGSPGQ